MLALISNTSGHVIFPYDATEDMTDEQIFRTVERKRPHNFTRHDWTVFRGRNWSEDNYSLKTWEVFLTARIRRVVAEVCARHEKAFDEWLESLPPLFPPEPPPPYRDPYATIEPPKGFSLFIPLRFFERVGPNTLGIYKPPTPPEVEE